MSVSTRELHRPTREAVDGPGEPTTPTRLSRRDFFFLAGSGAAGALVLGVHVADGAGVRPRPIGRGIVGVEADVAATGRSFAPNVWLSIAEDGETTIWLVKAEMGQGVYTALPMLVAEELDADWSRVRVSQPPVDPRFFPFVGTGGSSSVSSSWEPLRRAGAAAREMLVVAAARRWKVPVAECDTEPGVVIHAASGRRAEYGTLVDAAGRLPVPSEPRLKDRAKFRLIGQRTPRLDTPMKVDGSATFGIDARPPGMLFAVVARCPVYGGAVASFDPSRAKAVAGVRHVVPMHYRTDPAAADHSLRDPEAGARLAGIAIVADTTWAALEGRRALEVTWDEGPNREVDSASMSRLLDARCAQEGVPDRNDGDVAAALATSARTVTATYTAPFLAHATMEPLNATAHVTVDRCDVWGPFQSGDSAREVAARITGLSASAVTVHTTLLGGGFGRRAYSDFAGEAVIVAKAIGVPVQVLWSREDDTQHDLYRPPSRHVMAAGLDRDGGLLAWRHRMVTPSLRAQFDWGKDNEDILRGLDKWATDGSNYVPYRAPNFRVEFVMAPVPVPVGAWRSVYTSQTSFADECFVDEVAVACGKDPLQFRLDLIGGGSPRHRGVLERAAKEAGWDQPLPAGRFRGIAVYRANSSYVAQVAEVSVDADARVRVHRVVCAVDCGIVVNPDGVEAQMEGGILFGLGAALTGDITFARGRCQQSNFHDVPLLRLSDAPAIDVHIVASDLPPSGVGEPGVPPIAPAVANAVSAAIGRRVRELPLTPERIAALMNVKR